MHIGRCPHPDGRLILLPESHCRTYFHWDYCLVSKGVELHRALPVCTRNNRRRDGNWWQMPFTTTEVRSSSSFPTQAGPSTATWPSGLKPGLPLPLDAGKRCDIWEGQWPQCLTRWQLRKLSRPSSNSRKVLNWQKWQDSTEFNYEERMDTSLTNSLRFAVTLAPTNTAVLLKIESVSVSNCSTLH